ncbi:MAG: DUF1592 domain-containing protein, partial [Verrucomicrobiota bacterium]
RCFILLASLTLLGSFLECLQADAVFENRVLPLLEDACIDCHEPGMSKGGVPFLDVGHVSDIQHMRAIWRSVAAQLQNQTMPPPNKPQLDEEDRQFVTQWINNHLRKTAQEMTPFAGQIMARRLNRLEFDLTIQDLFGVDLKFSERFPTESGTGEGFDNNGESLFLPPMLLERYLEAAQETVDAAVLSPRLSKIVLKKEFSLKQGKHVALVPIYVDSGYRLVLKGNPTGSKIVSVMVDGLMAHEFNLASDRNSIIREEFDLKLSRGVHALTLEGLEPESLAIRQFAPQPPSQTEIANHVRLLGVKPGQRPAKPKELARRQLDSLLPLAFRRPVSPAEVQRFMPLVDRALERGDPYEEAMKLAMRGVLVSPDFLFRIEQKPSSPDIEMLNPYELASRLSYFLWSRMPDERLRNLARDGSLSKENVLRAEVRRMLSDDRSINFFRSFVGQWLGTKDVGGRVAPTANDVQEFYTPQIASDMRQEAVENVAYLARKNRCLLELVDSNYIITTGRLAEFYELPNARKLQKSTFQKVMNPGQQRGGLLGMGAVLALTSHHKKTSPVLRGVWVFDTVIGSPVPPPPADVPPLPQVEVDPETGKKRKLTDREKLQKHREHSSCMACHRIIDPIGFGLQNFDWVGRWRTQELKVPIDTTGKLPSGQSFTGPTELKKVLINAHEPEIVRNVSRKLLGYAIGRSLEDRDDGTIEKLALALEESHFGMGTLIEEIVLSVPFRNQQLLTPESNP